MEDRLAEMLATPVLRWYAAVSLLLVLKMLALAFYTGWLRLRRKVFAAPEDYGVVGAKPCLATDSQIERVRRAHLNDLENLVPFFVVGYLYALTDPSPLAAKTYYLGYLVARVLHSAFYLGAKQPHRTIAYTVAMVLLLVMLGETLARVLVLGQ